MTLWSKRQPMNSLVSSCILPPCPQPPATRAISQWASSLEWHHGVTLYFLVWKNCISFFLFYWEGMLSLVVLWLCEISPDDAFRAGLRKLRPKVINPEVFITNKQNQNYINCIIHKPILLTLSLTEFCKVKQTFSYDCFLLYFINCCKYIDKAILVFNSLCQCRKYDSIWFWQCESGFEWRNAIW